MELISLRWFALTQYRDRRKEELKAINVFTLARLADGMCLPVFSPIQFVLFWVTPVSVIVTDVVAPGTNSHQGLVDVGYFGRRLQACHCSTVSFKSSGH